MIISKLLCYGDGMMIKYYYYTTIYIITWRKKNYYFQTQTPARVPRGP